MKKTTLFLLLMMFSSLVYSQSGIGIRGIFGYSDGSFGGAALSYQSVGKFEINGAWSQKGYALSGLKLWNLVETGMVNIYTGLGAGAGFNDQLGEAQGVVMGDIGMGVSFGPVMFTLDMRPEYELIEPKGQPWRFNFGFAIRAMFPTKE